MAGAKRVLGNLRMLLQENQEPSCCPKQCTGTEPEAPAQSRCQGKNCSTVMQAGSCQAQELWGTWQEWTGARSTGPALKPSQLTDFLLALSLFRLCYRQNTPIHPPAPS